MSRIFKLLVLKIIYSLGFVPLVTMGQSNIIRADILEDKGYEHPKFNLNFLPIAGGQNMILRKTRFDLRLFGHLEMVTNKLGINFNLSHSTFTDDGAFIFGSEDNYNLSKELDVSGYFVFHRKAEERQIHITIEQKPFSNEETYTEIMAKWSAVSALKLGYVALNEDLNFRRIDVSPFFKLNPQRLYDLNISLSGFSFGVFRREYQHFVFEDIDKKKKYSSIKGKEYYADLLILPFQQFDDRVLETNLSDSVKSLGSVSPIGGKVGIKVFSADKRRYPRLSAFAEIGYWPYHGIRTHLGIGFCIINRH